MERQGRDAYLLAFRPINRAVWSFTGQQYFFMKQSRKLKCNRCK
ncbi:hypothetical protein EVA_08231 [gut metagenome]|uniref:Uncharacterized protein n=1 Tax=gut metagenome TaxID=749906 RepID=J9G8V3_9ZZZZ